MSAPTVTSLEVGNRLRPVLLRLSRALRREAGELGISGGQAAVLGMIMAHPELSVRELAALEGMSPPAMSGYLDRLEGGGWLIRERDPMDGRRVRLRVTRKGESILSSLRSRRTAWLAARLDDLSAAELEAVDAAIEPLLRLVDEAD